MLKRAFGCDLHARAARCRVCASRATRARISSQQGAWAEVVICTRWLERVSGRGSHCKQHTFRSETG